jgi:hypothetical protein
MQFEDYGFRRVIQLVKAAARKLVCSSIRPVLLNNGQSHKITTSSGLLIIAQAFRDVLKSVPSLPLVRKITL